MVKPSPDHKGPRRSISGRGGGKLTRHDVNPESEAEEAKDLKEKTQERVRGTKRGKFHPWRRILIRLPLIN